MKKTFNISNGDVEPWCGFRREDSETYNKVNGVWVLEEDKQRGINLRIYKQFNFSNQNHK